MAIMKVVEILASSPNSWEEATKNGVEKAAETIKGIRSAYVKEFSTVVKDNSVAEYRVNLKITFEVQ